jgi:hypothetical protein
MECKGKMRIGMKGSERNGKSERRVTISISGPSCMLAGFLELCFSSFGAGIPRQRLFGVICDRSR